MEHVSLSEAWAALAAHSAEMETQKIADFFAADPERYAKFHIQLNDVLFDFSKHRVTQ